jgi:transcriptional regulator with XRE-family HTH domain
MPTSADLASHGLHGTFESVGQRLRELRHARHVSIRELARTAGIDKNTVLRLERGEPVSAKVLNSVCVALNTVLPQVIAPVSETSNTSHFQTTADNWCIVFNTARSKSGLPDYTQVADPLERKRLGGLGFVTGFMQNHECSITNGTLQAAVIEVYGAYARPATHAGEEFMMCLTGKVDVQIGEDHFILSAGDSITFRSDLHHNFEQVSTDEAGFAPKILMVWIEGAPASLEPSKIDSRPGVP